MGIRCGRADIFILIAIASMVGAMKVNLTCKAIAAMFVVSSQAFAAVYIDDFSADHDYSSGDVQGTIWSGVLNYQNASSLNSGISNNGQLTIGFDGSVGAGWDSSLHNAPFLYLQVDGDFLATVHVSEASAAPFSNVGLLAIGDTTNFVMTGQNFYFGNYNSRVQIAGVDSDVQNSSGFTAGSFLRLERVGNVYTSSFSTDGISYTTLTTYTAASGPLAGESIMVGLSYQNYAAVPQVATFDNFEIVTVPEPSTYALMALGVAFSLIAARRRRVSV